MMREGGHYSLFINSLLVQETTDCPSKTAINITNQSKLARIDHTHSISASLNGVATKVGVSAA